MVNSVSKEGPVSVSKWDVALEALAREEYQKIDRALRVDDLRRLSTEYAIRFDDIIVTLFELCLHGEWEYRDGAGKVEEMTRERFDELTSAGRLKDKDLVGFDGAWAPLK